MTTFRVKFWTGPTQVDGWAEKTRAAGLRTMTGTEAVYTLVEATEKDAAIHNLMAALLQHDPTLTVGWIGGLHTSAVLHDPTDNPNDEVLERSFTL